MQHAESFSVAYRTGGPALCQWRRVYETFPTREAARACAERTERMGYKSNIYKTAELDRIGLPVGWDSSCNQEAGKVYVGRYVTEYRARA